MNVRVDSIEPNGWMRVSVEHMSAGQPRWSCRLVIGYGTDSVKVCVSDGPGSWSVMSSDQTELLAALDRLMAVAA